MAGQGKEHERLASQDVPRQTEDAGGPGVLSAPREKRRGLSVSAGTQQQAPRRGRPCRPPARPPPPSLCLSPRTRERQVHRRPGARGPGGRTRDTESTIQGGRCQEDWHERDVGLVPPTRPGRGRGGALRAVGAARADTGPRTSAGGRPGPLPHGPHPLSTQHS